MKWLAVKACQTAAPFGLLLGVCGAPVADRPLRTASCWAGSRATSNARPDASYMYYWVPPDASYVPIIENSGSYRTVS